MPAKPIILVDTEGKIKEGIVVEAKRFNKVSFDIGSTLKELVGGVSYSVMKNIDLGIYGSLKYKTLIQGVLEPKINIGIPLLEVKYV